MRIIEPSYEILTPINGDEVLKAIEKVARTCYKSEDKIGEGTAEKMILNLIKNGHEAMIEFFDITVKRAIFKLRTASSAHPDMRRVMIPLLEELRGKVPVIFDDITLIV